jgi:drug/metabolite transporter (DMT)-like permease
MSAPSLCCQAAPVVARKTEVAIRQTPPSWLVIAAFLAVYIVWGSTYLGIHVAVATIPPFLMAGTRFVLAGLLLYGAMRALGTPAPQPIHWRTATITGALLLVVGNGAISWVQLFAPTTLTAIMVAAVPLWMNLFEWLRPGGKRPALSTGIALVLGFVGVAMVILARSPGGQPVASAGVIAVLLAAPLCWAFGSIYARQAPQSPAHLLNIAMQMLCGGALMLGVGAIKGELTGFRLEQVSHASALAFVYLTLAGSLIGFTAYAWLLQVSTPAKVSTYAYVNPLIAVILGSVVLHERLPGGMLLAGSLILVSVIIITLRKS